MLPLKITSSTMQINSEKNAFLIVFIKVFNNNVKNKNFSVLLKDQDDLNIRSISYNAPYWSKSKTNMFNLIYDFTGQVSFMNT